MKTLVRETAERVLAPLRLIDVTKLTFDAAIAALRALALGILGEEELVIVENMIAERKHLLEHREAGMRFLSAVCSDLGGDRTAEAGYNERLPFMELARMLGAASQRAAEVAGA